MELQRRWGHVAEFDGFAESVGESDPAAPVVAVTLARMKLPRKPSAKFSGSCNLTAIFLH
jgi:hypothetical protein